MAKPTIVTRAGKGSALTWTEGDANFTNLQNATLTVTDGSNSKALDLNSTLTFTAGTNISISVNSSTGAVTVTNTQSATAPAGSNTQVQFNNSGSFGASSKLTFDGSKLTTENFAITNSSGDEGGELLLAKAQTNTTLSGTGVTIDVYQNKLRFFEQGGTARGAYIDLTAASAGVGSNLLSGGSFDPASPGAIGGTTAAAGTFTDLTSTGKLTFKQPVEAIYDLGTTGGTVAPNAANGSVQKITLNSALTINGFTSPVAGQSITLFIYGGTSYTSITSTMKFVGGIKTLTGTASCIDVLTIYYDGTTYFASLGKGYA